MLNIGKKEVHKVLSILKQKAMSYKNVKIPYFGLGCLHKNEKAVD